MRVFYIFNLTILILLSTVTQAKVCSGVGDLRSEAYININKLIKEKAELEALLKKDDIEALKQTAGTLAITALKIADSLASIALSKANPAAGLIASHIKVVSKTIINGEKSWDSTLEQVSNIKAIAGGDSVLVNSKINSAYGIFMTAYDIQKTFEDHFDTNDAIIGAGHSANRVLKRLEKQIVRMNKSASELPDC
jgi:hypothetical protein